MKKPTKKSKKPQRDSMEQRMRVSYPHAMAVLVNEAERLEELRKRSKKCAPVDAMIWSCKFAAAKLFAAYYASELPTPQDPALGILSYLALQPREGEMDPEGRKFKGSPKDNAELLDELILASRNLLGRKPNEHPGVYDRKIEAPKALAKKTRGREAKKSA